MADGVWQLPPEQQPLGQLPALQPLTHDNWPLDNTQLWLALHPTVPQMQVAAPLKVTTQYSFAPHGWQAWPPLPQAAPNGPRH
jgi:hypothetical protein